MDSVLKLSAHVKNCRTEICDLYAQGAYKVMQPFYCNLRTDIMPMCASAGILGGDDIKFEFNFGAKTNAQILSQSYEKIFNSNGKTSKKTLTINVSENANIRYMPYPVIPFAKSEFQSKNSIYISSNSNVAYADIVSCGRVGIGELFKMNIYESISEFYIDNKLEYLDHMLLEPKNFDYTGIGFFENYTHSGLLFIHKPSLTELENKKCEIRIAKKNFDGHIGISQTENSLVIRALSNQGEKLWNFFNEIA